MALPGCTGRCLTRIPCHKSVKGFGAIITKFTPVVEVVNVVSTLICVANADDAAPGGSRVIARSATLIAPVLATVESLAIPIPANMLIPVAFE